MTTVLCRGCIGNYLAPWIHPDPSTLPQRPSPATHTVPRRGSSSVARLATSARAPCRNQRDPETRGPAGSERWPIASDGFLVGRTWQKNQRCPRGQVVHCPFRSTARKSAVPRPRDQVSSGCVPGSSEPRANPWCLPDLPPAGSIAWLLRYRPGLRMPCPDSRPPGALADHLPAGQPIDCRGIPRRGGSVPGHATAVVDPSASDLAASVHRRTHHEYLHGPPGHETGFSRDTRAPAGACRPGRAR